MQQFFLTKSFKDHLVTLTGTIINGLLGAIFYFITARSLGPEDFGRLGLSITVLTLVNDLTDFGLSTAIVNFVGKFYHQDLERALRFLNLSFFFKLLISIFILVLGWVLAPLIAHYIFQKDQLESALRFSFIGAVTAQLLGFTLSTLQALQKYKTWSLVQLASNGIRVISLVLLIHLNLLDLNSTFIIYIMMPLLGFMFGSFFLPIRFIKVSDPLQVKNQLFHYSKWVALFTFIVAISSRLDTFITARLLTFEQLGFYSAANQLVTIIPQIVVALGSVFGPRMARLQNLVEFRGYLKESSLIVLGLAGLGILSIPLVLILIPIIYGPLYANALPLIFAILFLSMIIFLIATPFHNAVIYYFNYPKLFTYISIGNILIVGGLGWILISKFGLVGAASTVLINNVFAFVVPTLYVMKRVRKI